MKRTLSSLVRRATRPLAWLLVLVALALPAPARAASVTGPGVPAASMWEWDSIVGNRSRMIQVATIGMALAIFILTRGHKHGR